MPQNEPKPLATFRDGMALTLWMTESLSVFPAVFLHRLGSWGKRCPPPMVSLSAVVTPLLAFAVVGGQDSHLPPSLRRNHDAEAFLLFWAVWLIGFLLHKLTASSRQVSYYDGTPWLTGCRFEVTVKRFLEPMLCIGFGYWMHERNLPAFGSFWVLCGMAYGLSTALAKRQMDHLAWDWNDAEKNAALQRAWADHYRHRR